MLCMPAYMVLPVFFWVTLITGIFGLQPAALLASVIIGAIWYFMIMKTNWYPRSRKFIDMIRAKMEK